MLAIDSHTIALGSFLLSEFYIQISEAYILKTRKHGVIHWLKWIDCLLIGEYCRFFEVPTSLHLCFDTNCWKLVQGLRTDSLTDNRTINKINYVDEVEPRAKDTIQVRWRKWTAGLRACSHYQLSYFSELNITRWVKLKWIVSSRSWPWRFFGKNPLATLT